MNIDIFSIPVYYISFTKNNLLEENLRKIGFSNINHFQSIDVREEDLEKLLRDKVISVRAYIDLTEGRKEHVGMTSKGAIGCSLSHYSLWKKCIENQYDNIMILEGDCDINGPLTDKEIRYITMALSKENGVFISFNERVNGYFGTHFYIASNGGCRILSDYMMPIDMQVDGYIYTLSHTTLLNITHLHIYDTVSSKSTTSDGNIFCLACHLPRKDRTYIIFLVIIILLVVFILMYSKR